MPQMEKYGLAVGGQIAIPATWMRGGTSKALFFLETDLPPKGAARDAAIKRAMGCPHGLQIDGVGGGRGNTSKIAIVGVSERPDADIDYTFAQVGIDEDFIDYRATCGNISAAVGPFSVLKGLVRAAGDSVRLRIYNSNIDDVLFQDVPVADGGPKIEGDFINAGVNDTGAEIFTDFSRAIGRRTGRLLPTGKVRDTLHLDSGRVIEATLLDVANPVAYVPASDLGLVGTERPQILQSNDQLMRDIADIRLKAAELMGLTGIFSVRVGIVAPPSSYEGSDGTLIDADQMDFCGRFFALAYCAPNYPGTASVSTGAAARIPGSVVYATIPAVLRDKAMLRIGHPNGVMEVLATARSSDDVAGVTIERLGFGRTARAIMDGIVFLPRAFLAS